MTEPSVCLCPVLLLVILCEGAGSIVLYGCERREVEERERERERGKRGRGRERWREQKKIEKEDKKREGQPSVCSCPRLLLDYILLYVKEEDLLSCTNVCVK